MKAISRSLVMIFVALIAVPALAVTQTLTTAFQLLAGTTILVLGGTEHPLSPDVDSDAFVNGYFNQARNNFIFPNDPNPEAPVNTYAVIYPAQFFPVFGSTTFDASVAEGRSNLGHCLGVTAGPCVYNTNAGVVDPNTDGTPPPAVTPGAKFIVFGYSQSAVVAALTKRDLIAQYADNPEDAPNVDIYLAADPMRPNGGILARGFEGQTIPLLGITFYGAAPTNSCDNNGPCFQTVDVAQQYDLLGGDAPAVPWNILAWANSAAAYYYLHGDVPTHSITEDGVIQQQSTGDTDYYLITSGRLPILLPLQQAGVPDPILAVVDAPLRVLIEAGSYRGTGPGEQVGFQLLTEKDLGTLAVDLAESIPVGIDDGLQEAGLGRALGTNDVYRPFGVGGETYAKGPGGTSNPQGVETGVGGVWSAPVPDLEDASVQAAAAPPVKNTQPETGEQQKVTTQDDTKVTNGDTGQTISLPDAIKPPRPLQVIRDSLNFGTHKSPLGIHPDGEGPLKKIVNALTGQRPKDDTAGTEDKEADKPAA